MAYSEQRVTSIHKWSEKTFSFTTTRPQDFRFENGEFVTLGLKPEGKLIARAYSIVSNNDTEHLEFLSIHVPDGPLTSRLAQIQIGEGVWINSKTTGSDAQTCVTGEGPVYVVDRYRSGTLHVVDSQPRIV